MSDAAQQAAKVPFPFDREDPKFLPLTTPTQLERLQQLHRERDCGRTMLVSTPSVEDSWAKRAYLGFDVALSEGDYTACALLVDGVFVPVPLPDGFIRFTHEGGTEEPMAYWLKPGVTAESLRLGASDAHAVCDGASTPEHNTEG